MTSPEDRSAALLVRVWLEDGPDGFRARLTSIRSYRPASQPEELTVAIAATPGEVVDAVSEWLSEWLGQSHESD